MAGLHGALYPTSDSMKEPFITKEAIEFEETPAGSRHTNADKETNVGEKDGSHSDNNNTLTNGSLTIIRSMPFNYVS